VSTDIAHAQEPLPVSVARIREALANAPTDPFINLRTPAQFRVSIVERPRFFDLPPASDWRGGPIPPGGLYAYEQRQQIGPSLAQPLISIDVLPIASLLAASVRSASRARALEAARNEVRREIAMYCAAQPAVQICSTSAAIR